MQPKHPPHSMEAEQSVIGAMLLDTKAIIDCAEILTVNDFYNHDHRVIFGSIIELSKTCDSIDFVTFSEYLRSKDFLEQAGGITYIGTLAADTPSSANAKAYAEIVRNRAQLRALIAAGNMIADIGYRPDGRTAEEAHEEAEKLLNECRLKGRRGQDEDEGYDTLVGQVEKDLERAYHGEKRHGLDTGIVQLDELTTGFYDGDLIVLGARPAMGKTALALNIAEYQAHVQRNAVGIFSMEMTKKQLVERSVSAFGRIDSQKIRTGKLDMVDWERYVGASGILRELPIYIDATRDLSMNELRSRAKRMHHKRKLKLLIIDYLQLMATPGKDRRDVEIGAISRGLKNLAGELGIPVIALSQLNRGLEARENKRPRMADLRESGGIEQDADLILFIYRDEVYNGSDSKYAGTAEIIIGKQRNGPTGFVRTAFHSQYNRFDNLHPDWQEFTGAGPQKTRKKKTGFSAEELNGGIV